MYNKCFSIHVTMENKFTYYKLEYNVSFTKLWEYGIKELKKKKVVINQKQYRNVPKVNLIIFQILFYGTRKNSYMLRVLSDLSENLKQSFSPNMTKILLNSAKPSHQLLKVRDNVRASKVMRLKEMRQTPL